jgi:hypothetical protein
MLARASTHIEVETGRTAELRFSKDDSKDGTQRHQTGSGLLELSLKYVAPMCLSSITAQTWSILRPSPTSKSSL